VSECECECMHVCILCISLSLSLCVCAGYMMKCVYECVWIILWHGNVCVSVRVSACVEPRTVMFVCMRARDVQCTLVRCDASLCVVRLLALTYIICMYSVCTRCVRTLYISLCALLWCMCLHTPAHTHTLILAHSHMLSSLCSWAWIMEVCVRG